MEVTSCIQLFWNFLNLVFIATVGAKIFPTLIISQFPVHCMSYALLHELVCGIDSYTSVEMICSGERSSWLD